MKPSRHLSDDDCVAYCNTLKSPLREDIAAILQWDLGPERVPRTTQIAKIYGVPPPRAHAEPHEVEQALEGIGYTNAKARVSNVTEYVQMMRMARARFITKRSKEKHSAEIRRDKA